MKKKLKMSLLRKISITLAVFVIYLMSTIPVGMFLYSLKSKMGIDVFINAGYHSYASCLEKQMHQIKESKDDDNNK